MMDTNDVIKEVNTYLTGLLQKDMDVYAASRHLVLAGGKRLRPLMVVRVYEALGGDGREVIPAASSVELVHNFTLIHDDIMDNDDFRRGVPTVHKAYGVPLAILAGDLLFALGYKAISDSKPFMEDERKFFRAVNALSRYVIELCEGQNMDIKPPAEFNDRYYFELIKKKTSSLFMLSALYGVYGMGRYDLEGYAEKFGENFGIIFQLTDDLLGLIGNPEVTKKPVGSDLREGKSTLPIHLAIRKADGELRSRILSVYGKGADNRIMEDIVNRIRALNIEEDVKRIIRVYLNEALSALDHLGSGDANSELRKMVEGLVERQY